MDAKLEKTLGDSLRQHHGLIATEHKRALRLTGALGRRLEWAIKDIRNEANELDKRLAPPKGLVDSYAVYVRGLTRLLAEARQLEKARGAQPLSDIELDAELGTVVRDVVASLSDAEWSEVVHTRNVAEKRAARPRKKGKPSAGGSVH